MLNKEMLLNSAKKDEPHVIVTNDVMNRIPYWDFDTRIIQITSIEFYYRQIECLTRISADVSGKSGEDNYIEATCLENGMSTGNMIFADYVHGRDLTAFIAYADVFDLSNGPRSFVFTPPPQTVIYNSSHHLFNGGGLNVREGDASGVEEIGATDRKQSDCAVVRGKWIYHWKRCACREVYNLYEQRYWRSNIFSGISSNNCIQLQVGTHSRSKKQCKYRKRFWQLQLRCFRYPNRPFQARNNRRLQQLLTSRMGGSHAE